MSNILTLKGFGLSFGNRRILHNIDLAVSNRGVTVLLGPSGTGKSSLLRTLAGFNEANPSAHIWGQVEYAGKDIVDADRRPALVMQKATLMVSTVQENLLSELPNRSSLTKLQQVELLSTFCDQLDQDWIVEKLTAPVVQLELCQQRTVAIIRETLGQPRLLMLDEPTAGMDTEAAATICALIRKVSERQPVLMVSHHLAQTRHLADFVVLIAGGITQESSTATAFFSAPQSAAAKQYIVSGSCPDIAEAPLSQEEPTLPADTKPASPVADEASLYAKSRYMGPRGFVWLIPGKVAGTPWPGIISDPRHDLQALHNVGINRLVSLTEMPFDEKLAGEYSIACKNIPIPDMQAPAITVAQALCLDIDQWVLNGEAIAIHCKAGLGRTGTLLATYWLWCGQGSRTALAAIEHVRRIESGMIQSQEQVDFLSAFDVFLKHEQNPVMTSG